MANFHQDGNNLSKRIDSAVELADVTKHNAFGPGGSSSSTATHAVQEPFVGAHNAKKYKVEWNEHEYAVLHDPLITDITGWLKQKKQS